ncbi:MAG: heavy metal translocating P-type ATPase metal-binding domain-containing protein [Planctomycetes bacterium]|nr:heavy metal translocating P-type ATPase metal-binding domain-containing protein [Planctomycetota bacterium]
MSAVCQHCELPLGASARAEFDSFCCEGCRTVYQLIRSEGLERYYELRSGGDSPPPALRADSYAWLDAALAAAPRSETGLVRLTLDVQGVHCAACVWLLEQLWKRHAGGLELRINPALGRADFAWHAGELDVREYLHAAERFGYRFGLARKGDLGVSRALVVRMGISFAAALNVMIFSLCYYAGLAPNEGALYTVLGRWSFALATIAVLAGGSLFFRSAWESLRRGLAHLDVPIALGIALGYGGSVWAWMAHGPESAYFDTITIFIALMVLGRWLQERVLQRNRLSILASEGIDDLYTRRRRAGALETVPAAAIEPGDELWILPGDLVPVEGTLLGMRARMSLDWITGESRPQHFEPGATVPAGAFQAGDAPVRLCARQGFAASRLQTLLGSGAAAQRSSRVASSSSRFAGAYVLAVLLLAGAGFAFWLSAGAERAIEVALSVLVVTCPCALGLALPLAHELVHSGLRRRGIFLREAGFLERVLHVKHVLFDKTGTLTRGALRLTPFARAELAGLEPELRALLADATGRSLHPTSRAIHAELSRGEPTPLDPELEVREIAGRGLELRRRERRFELVRGERGTLFREGERTLAVIEVEEQLKSDARTELAALQREGYAVHLLSGDRAERAASIGAELGLPSGRVHGAFSPEDKAEYVRALDQGDTWMVGDGINDAPAFDAAFCAATPAVDRPSLPARADLFYLGDGVSAVRVTLEWARRLSAVLRTNLVLAVLYNAAVVSLALAGRVSPLVAAVLMPLSSLCFLSLTTLRLSARRTAWTS